MDYPDYIRQKHPELSAGSLMDDSILLSYAEKFRSPTLNIPNEEWDVLVILDACRYDYFKKHNFIEGELESRYSLGCCTPEWIEHTFRRTVVDMIFGRKRNFEDIVYVSGNPFISGFMLREILGNSNPFHKIEKVWDDGWDEESDTVLPDTLTERALKAVKDYPGKRIIVHYMQPHAPYLGLNEAYKDMFGWKMLRSDIKRKTHPDLLPRGGEVRIGDLIQAYIDNLTFVLKSISKFSELDKVVRVTADHGECLGEYVSDMGRRIFGHPPGVDIRALREVPWFLMKTRHCSIENEQGDENQSFWSRLAF